MVQQHITAVYEYGFLRPLEPLSLPEKQKVHIQFLTVPEPETDSEIGPETGPEIGSEFECKPVSATCPEMDKTDQILQFLVKTGLLTQPSDPVTALLSKTERKQLTDALAQHTKRTLSEMVIEDRGPW